MAAALVRIVLLIRRTRRAVLPLRRTVALLLRRAVLSLRRTVLSLWTILALLLRRTVLPLRMGAVLPLRRTVALLLRRTILPLRTLIAGGLLRTFARFPRLPVRTRRLLTFLPALLRTRRSGR